MAEERKHTEGPWVEFADQGNTVAIMPAMRPGDVCKFAMPYPTRANARLMAEAPRLVAALDTIAGACDDIAAVIEDEGGPEGDRRAWQAIAKIARAAIKRATEG